MSQAKYASYADITNPDLKHAINKNCLSTIHLATLVAGFAQEMATAHEHFAQEIQNIVSSFRNKSKDMKKERYVDTVSTICNVWEILLKETEVDAQAHVDAAGLLIKNVCEPLQEVAEHKRSQAEKLQAFRDNFEDTLHQSENKFFETERVYMDSYGAFKNCGSLDNREGLRHEFHNAHNDYILQIRASNRIIDEFQIAIPQVLESYRGGQCTYPCFPGFLTPVLAHHSFEVTDYFLTCYQRSTKHPEKTSKRCCEAKPCPRFIWTKLRQTPVQWPVKVVGQTEDGLSVYVKSDHAVNEVPADDEIFAEMSESEAENEDDLEVLDDDDEPKKSKSVKHKRQRWDSVETEEINKYFKHFLDAGIVPRTKDLDYSKNRGAILLTLASAYAFALHKELDEIYIDTSNTINVAIESHSLLLLTKANEQQRRLENLLKCCRQVNPQLDITYFIKAIPLEEATISLQRHQFCPAEHSINSMEESIVNHLIIDRISEIVLREKRAGLQKEALELASYIKQNQDITHSLVNICQRNLANHLYAKVYETQEDMCRKRNEIRVAKLQLGAIRAQIELLTPKQNGAVDDEQEKKNPSMIRGMWKKAFKTLKSSPSVEKLAKKSSFHKKKQNSKEADEEIEQLNTGPVDPVYSLLKCAADLPRSGGKSPCLTHPHCSGQHPPSYARYPSGGDSSGNTSKTSSPSSSASHSPKTRRKKLNARMKSFSLDTPEPPKQLLGIDESTKKKSSSFTNTCFGAPTSLGRESPDEKVTAFSASALRKKFAFGKASSLEIEDKKHRSYSPSPKQSPKSQRKEKQSLYVALYNFKAKEKDDMDLRAGWRVTITDSSKKDWWKGKSHGKMGYFPAAYVIPIQSDQRVFQITQPLNLSEGNYSVKFHKDQIVFQIGAETDGMILVKAANNKQAMCPTTYLLEL